MQFREKHTKPRATLCVFSHAKIETTNSKGVHCSINQIGNLLIANNICV